jgi:hypothetical protein
MTMCANLMSEVMTALYLLPQSAGYASNVLEALLS